MRSLPSLGGLVLLAAPAGAWALGLGDIQLHSALDQPFEAEIPLLSATPDELQNIKVGLASPETFDRYGLDRPSDLSALTFKIGKSASGRNVILVTSTRRIDDPFLTMLVEVTSRSGRLLHEYTVLLDPPVLLRGPAEQAPIRQARAESPQPAAAAGAIARAPTTQTPPGQTRTGQTRTAQTSASPASTPAAASSSGATSPGSQPAAAPGGRQARSASAPSGAPAGAARPARPGAAGPGPGGTYGPVQRNQTLWGIASTLKPADVTTNQMMLALYRANPDAFESNINLLRRGAILTVPNRSALLAATPAAATAEVRRQIESWQSRPQPEQARLRLVAPSEGETAPGAGGAGESAAAGESGASAQGGAGGAGGAAGGDAGAAAGASQAEVANLRDRVDSLQGQLDENRRLLQLKDQQLQALQEQLKKASAGGAATPPAEAATAAAGTTAPGVALESESLFSDEAGRQKPAGAPGADSSATQGPDAGASPQTQAAGTATEPPAEARPAPAAAPKPTSPPPVKKAAVARAVPAAPAPSLLSRVLGWIANPVLLIGLGVAAVLLTAVWYLRHRREEADDVTGRWDALEAEIEEETRTATTRVRRPAEDASMIVEEQSRRSQTAEIGDEAFSPEAAAAQARTQPGDETLSTQTLINLDQADPVAEADFHMAYGLYDQAAELVTKALEAEPNRRDLQLKLLEVYFVWGNKEAFLDAARDLREDIGDAADPDWDKVLIMGKQICPDEPMFAESAAAGSVDVDLQGAGSTELDFAFDEKETGRDGGADLFGDDDGDGLDLELAGTGERLVADEDDEADAAGGQELKRDPGESLDIGAQTAAGLEAALFMEEAETGSATKPDLEFDSLAATQESQTFEGRPEQDDDWASLLDEAAADDGDGDDFTGPVESPTVETAYGADSPAGSDSPTVESPMLETAYSDSPTMEAAVPDSPTVESPTIETAYSDSPTMEAAGPDSPTIESPTIETAFGHSDSPTMQTAYSGAAELSDAENSEFGGPAEQTEEIDLDDLGLNVGELAGLPEDVGEALSADADSDTAEQPALAGDDNLLSATGVTEVLLEDELELHGEAIELESASADESEERDDDDLERTDRPEGAGDEIFVDAGVDSQAEAELEGEGADGADLEQMDTSVLADYDATLMAPGFDDGTFVGTEVLEQRRQMEPSGDTSLMKSLTGFGGDNEAAEGGLDLNLEDLSAALEGGETAEQPRAAAFGDFFGGAGETPLDLDVGDDLPGPDDPTGTENMGPLDPQTMTEIGTKLDLARAYIDMGDPEGARSILEEVLDEGDPGQRREAQGLIDVLSA